MYVSTSLMGGLGNRLFQIACGMGYETLHPNYTYVIQPQHIAKYNPNQHGNHQYFYRNIPQIDYPSIHWTEPENAPCVFHNLPDYDDSIYLIGFFQSEKYFAHIREKILQQFGCPSYIQEGLISKYPELNKGVFIHIRRGDYVNNRLHYLDLTNYYKHCISLFTNVHFYICSDDIEWCKSQELFSSLPEKTFIQENEVMSLWLMSQCQLGGICANSSFSWWGGWLNTSSSKKIYYPNRQFATNYFMTTDLIPNNFIMIDIE